MGTVTITQEQIKKVLAYRNEQITLLNSIKGRSVSQDLLHVQINAIENVLLILGIDFDK